MSTYTKDRLKSVNHVRTIQRDWLAQTRDRVSSGEHFAVCNGDVCEEIFIAMNIPVMVVNYWNYIIVSQNKTAQYFDVRYASAAMSATSSSRSALPRRSSRAMRPGAGCRNRP